MSRIVNGASLQPLSGSRPEQIVLLLHGYDSNGADLVSLAPHWQRALPGALFLAPNAPEPCGPLAGGYQWWGLDAFTPRALHEGATRAAPAIDNFIDRKLAQYGLDEAKLAIVGFSQGTMMALHVGLRRERQIACILGYSGMLTGVAELGEHLATRPPVLLIHGSADTVVPVASLHAAKSGLQRLGVEVTSHISSGLGHSVDPAGLKLGGEFVANALT
jgi:phospholipase/carboxylesterase